MAAILAPLSAHSATFTWTGASSTDFEVAGNWNGGVPATTGLIVFGTNAGTVNQPLQTTATRTIGELGFAGAGWLLSGSGKTLTLGSNPISMAGVGSAPGPYTIGAGAYVLASSGAGINEIAPHVVVSTASGANVFVDTGNTLKLDGNYTATGGTSTWTGTGTFNVLGATSTGAITSQTGVTANLSGGLAMGSGALNLGAFVYPGSAASPASTVNVSGGAFSTSGVLNIGAGALNVGSTATGFSSGAISVYSQGTLSIANSGATPAIGSAVTSSVYAGGKLVFDNSVNNVNRISTPAAGNAITLTGGELSLIGNAGATTAQNAFLTFHASSAETISLGVGSGQLTSLTNVNTTNNLVSASTVGGTVLIRGLNLGSAVGTIGGEAQYFTATAPTAVGGLIPWAIGDTTGVTGKGNTFLSYNGTTGFTPVVSTASTLLAAGAATNVLQTANDASMTGTKTINSLFVRGDNLTTTLTGTLNVTSGAVLFTSGANGDTLNGGILASAGSARLYVYAQDGAAANDLTVNSAIDLSRLFTKSGEGTMLVNTPFNGTGGITVAQGTLKLGAANLLGAGNTLAAGNALYVGSGATFDLNGFSLTTTSNNFGKANIQNSPAGQITNSSGTQSTLNFNVTGSTAERITGNIAVNVNGGVMSFQSSASPLAVGALVNTYTGNTTLNSGGTLNANDSQLGAYSNQLVFAGGTLQMATNAAFSASRNIIVNAGTTGSAIQVDGNATAPFSLGIAGSIASGGTGSNLIFRGGSGANSGAASNLNFTAGTGNAVADNLDIVLNGGSNPLNVTFVGNESLGSLASTGTFITSIGMNTTAGTLTLGGNNVSTSYSGVIRNATATTALNKTGTGTLTLSGPNTFTGGTTVSNGILSLTGGSSIVPATQSVTTNTTAATANTVTVADSSGLVVGQAISGVAGIPTGAYITSILSPTSITISIKATAAGTTTATFGAYSGLGTGAIVVNNGATLSVSGGALQNSSGNMTINGGGYSGQTGALVNTTGTNSYAGTVTLGSASTISSDAGTFNLTNTGSINGAGFGLTLAGAGNGRLSGSISTGTGTLVKTGNGTWNLTGGSSYSGGTTISGGKLTVNNTTGSATGTGTVLVQGLATLAGGNGLASGGSSSTLGSGGNVGSRATYNGNVVGIISGATTIAGTGHLAPGNSVGTLTVGALTLNAGAIVDYEFNGSLNDFTLVTSAGGLTLNGGGFNLYDEGTNNLFSATGLYNLFAYSGTLNGTVANLSVLNGDFSNYSYSFLNNTTDGLIQLQISTVPEPSAATFMTGGFVGLIALRRRSRRS